METIKAFNEDGQIQKKFKDLFEFFNPEIILETGTYLGDTTEFLCNFGVQVISTEINQDYFNISKERLKEKNNLLLLLGDSHEVLNENFGLIKEKKIMCFLDSHNLNDKVLERELTLLKNLIINPIIIIHDFYVPGKNFYFDTWDGHRYDLEFYKPYFDEIYGVDNYNVSYNDDSVYSNALNNIPVGIIILEPKINGN
jgi:predicted O-methyltransferase YrrM